MKLDEEQNIVGEVLTSKLLQTVLWAVVRVDFQDYILCSFFELKIGERQVKFFGVFLYSLRSCFSSDSIGIQGHYFGLCSQYSDQCK